MDVALFEEGIIVDGDLQSKPYIIRDLNIDFLNEIINIQNNFLSTLQDTKLFYPLTFDEYSEALLSQGLVKGVLVEGKLIGYLALTDNDKAWQSVIPYSGIDESHKNKILFFDSTIVEPDFRGHNFLGKMMNLSLKNLIDNGNFEVGLTSVYPYNYNSLKNVLVHGFLGVNIKEIYNGYLRYILVYDKRFCEVLENNIRINVDSKDILKQIKLINDGYFACSAEKKENGFDIIFSKFYLDGDKNYA